MIYFIGRGAAAAGEERTGGGLLNRKPTPITTAATLKNKFRAISKVSPLVLSTLPPPSSSSSLRREGIVLHDPDPLTRSPETSVVDSSNQLKKSNLLHTIKIYLHGSNNNNGTTSISRLEAIDGDCCNPIQSDEDIGQQQTCGEPDRPQTQYQLSPSTQSDRRDNFPLGSTSTSIIRDSVNTSLSIFCSAAGGKPITEVVGESARNFLLDNEPKSAGLASVESMTSSPANSTYDDVETILESLHDPNGTVVGGDLDSEFREVLHFNIGQEVRTPLPHLRAQLRHVTSLESSDEEYAATEKEWSGYGDTTAAAAAVTPKIGGESKNLCVSSEQRPPKPTSRRSRRLIQFHNLQDSAENGDNDKTAGTGAPGDCDENVRSQANEFQSLEEQYYSGSGPTAAADGLHSVVVGDGVLVGDESGVMPAHGDLLFIDQGDLDTVQ